MAERKRIGWITAALLSASLVGWSYAQAQTPQNPPCENRDALIAHLATGYGEHPRHGGVVGNGATFEVFVANHGTWSMVVHFPTGRSCVMAVGTDWEERGGKT